MKLERDGFKTHFVTIFNIFRRDEEDEQKDRKCSRSYVEDLFVESDEVAAKKFKLSRFCFAESRILDFHK